MQQTKAQIVVSAIAESGKQNAETVTVLIGEFGDERFKFSIPKYDIEETVELVRKDTSVSQTVSVRCKHSKRVTLENPPVIQISPLGSDTDFGYDFKYGSKIASIECYPLYVCIDKMVTAAKSDINSRTTPSSWFNNCNIDVPEYTLKAENRTISRRNSSMHETFLQFTESDEQAELWKEALLTHPGPPTHSFSKTLIAPDGTVDGETLTIREYVDRTYYIDAEQVINQYKLLSMSIYDFSVGQVIRWKEKSADSPSYGVVTKSADPDTYLSRPKVQKNQRAELTIDTAGSSDCLVIGYPNLMSSIEWLDIPSNDELSEAPEWVLDVRDGVLQKQEDIKRFDELELEVVERNRRNRRAKQSTNSEVLKISGTMGQVTVECRNVFDFGFVSDIKNTSETGLEDDVKRVVNQFAREKTKISTRIRM